MPTIRTTSDVLTVAQSTDLTLLKRLRPFIFGPKAGLHRYSKASEKTGILAGYYNSASDTAYDWPGKADGSIIDSTFTKVWIENALLNYFNDYEGTGSAVAPVAGHANRVRAAGDIFETANGYSRSGALYDRDVAVGDIVELRHAGTTLYTSVTDLVADMTAASVSSATSDSNNKITQILSVSISQVADTPMNDVDVSANGAAYTSLVDGYITRTYTITVIQGSTGGDATTGRLSVTSADGLDDQASVTPAAFGAPTSIGTKGLTVTFSINSMLGSSSLVDEADFLLGQQWTCTVSQAFTAPVPTSGGTFSGTSDTTYIVRVTRGGLYASSPQITVSTTTGVDSSGPTNVTATGTFVAIGSEGTEIKFNATGLRAGDIYYVPVVASAPAQVRTLVLLNDLPAALAVATDMDLRLFIKVPLVEVSENYTVPSVFTAWTQDDSGVTVSGALQLTTTGLTNSGSPVYVSVESASTPGYGKLYIEYREWLQDQADIIYDIAKRSDVATVLGTVDPDNPIAFAVDVALQNTAGAVLANPNPAAATNSDIVKCSIVNGDPTETATWQDMLNLIAGEDDAYNLVPLTTTQAILDLVAAQIAVQSTVAVPNYCAGLFSAQIEAPSPVVDQAKSSDGNVVLATISATTGSSPTAYTTVTVPAGNANFITNGVQAGDTFRYSYTVDPFGDPTWTEYEVASVVSESSLLLVSGPTGAVSVAQRMEVWHPVVPTDVVTQTIALRTHYASKRICLVWPDTAVAGGAIVAGYFVCAALGGLLGAVAPHQGVRNVQILGFDSFPRSRSYLRTSSLDAMGADGVMVLTTAPDGTNYIRWAVTTDPTETNTSQEMMRRDIDMFTLNLLKDVWGTFIGNANVTGSLITALTAALSNFTNRILRSTNVGNLGPAILTATVNSIGPSQVNVDQVNADLTVVGPAPNDAINLTVQI